MNLRIVTTAFVYNAKSRGGLRGLSLAIADFAGTRSKPELMVFSSIANVSFVPESQQTVAEIHEIPKLLLRHPASSRIYAIVRARVTPWEVADRRSPESRYPQHDRGKVR
jgi:hypothetical protein